MRDASSVMGRWTSSLLSIGISHSQTLEGCSRANYTTPSFITNAHIEPCNELARAASTPVGKACRKSLTVNNCKRIVWG